MSPKQFCITSILRACSFTLNLSEPDPKLWTLNRLLLLQRKSLRNIYGLDNAQSVRSLFNASILPIEYFNVSQTSILLLFVFDQKWSYHLMSTSMTLGRVTCFTMIMFSWSLEVMRSCWSCHLLSDWLFFWFKYW